MDSYEATRVVFTRIQNLDPEYASKIMGLLLIQDHGEKEMIRLAFGPESLVHSVIHKARKELGIPSANSPSSTPSSPSSPSPFSRQNSSNSTTSRLTNNGVTNIPSPLSIPSLSSSWSEDTHHLNSAAPPFYGGSTEPDLLDELHIQDQLSFLNDGSPHFYPDLVSPNGSGEIFSPWGGGAAGGPHRRSASVNDVCLGGGDDGWKPCLYFAKGYCKNGASCRFTHGNGGEADMAANVMEQCQELLRSKSAHQQRLLLAAAAAAAAAGSPPNFPFPNSPKSMDFLLRQQSESPRMAAAAAAALMMGEDMNKFGRSRNDFSMGMLNPGSRQIYLTFPADSTFREEDVSNYFSMYGPVQDVRIPYQQKRMFGFVTFVYAETVKLILAKGNPHFVCDARVLVKPYKEKGKVPDKFRKHNQQQMERGDFSSCGSPTGFDSRDPFDLGARMLYNSQDLLWRKKLEEQADLQHAVELQNRRLMDLQLLDVKRSHHHRALSTGAAILSPTYSPSYLNHSVFASNNSSSSSPDSEDGLMSKMVTPVNINVDEPFEANLSLEKDKESLDLKDENSNGKSSPHNDDEEIDLPESFEHNLPDNLFTSPKASGEYRTVFSNDYNAPVSSAPFSSTNSNLITSPLLPAASTLDMASLKSCYFQFPRFSSDHGAIGM
ncbi:zinc finger CCCH domain-containing protein 53-like protein [Tanacetum coccineum]|uniref:Zinc finger CCCH domain-containing protein 53-like protein n=1 Tax=Tanacetum coccineum TaxID=301880 RepID=A0ABQ4ZB31_9ASTR